MPSELTQEETELLQPDVVYPVWSPYDAFAAAAVMLNVLARPRLAPLEPDLFESELCAVWSVSL